MASATVYTRAFCPLCVRAIALLQGKGVEVTEIDATGDPARREEMFSRSGRWTFPQIFLGEIHVGGCDDLQTLEQQGGLDPLLMGT
jgi:glutaredoxin 3